MYSRLRYINSCIITIQRFLSLQHTKCFLPELSKTSYKNLVILIRLSLWNIAEYDIISVIGFSLDISWIENGKENEFRVKLYQTIFIHVERCGWQAVGQLGCSETHLTTGSWIIMMWVFLFVLLGGCGGMRGYC